MSVLEVLGGGKAPYPHSLCWDTPSLTPLSAWAQAWWVSSLLKQWLWALLPKWMSKGGTGPALKRSCCAWSVAGGAGAEVLTHPLPSRKGLSLHFPQTLALPLYSLLIPFSCCPALGPTTPLTNSFPHFSSQIRDTGTPPTSSPKEGGLGADIPSVLSSLLFPSSPLLSHPLTFHPGQEWA